MSLLVENLDLFAQVATGLIAALIAFLIYNHNRVTEKEAVKSQSWQSQQSINEIILANPHLIKPSEALIDGSVEGLDENQKILAQYICFMHINRMNFIWRGWKSGLIPKKEAISECKPIMAVSATNSLLFQSCLKRGYSEKFVRFVTGIMEQA